MNYEYYYHKGMLYRTLDGKVWAMVEGKGWMEGWDSGDSINEKNLIKEDDARKLVERLGEIF